MVMIVSIVLNQVARTIIESRRGVDRTFVFTYQRQTNHSDDDVGVETCASGGWTATGSRS